MALGSFHSRTHDPKVAMYPILCDYNMPPPGMLPFIFPLCKIFEYEVQFPMGSLTRPVTGYGAHDHTGDHEYSNDYEGSLHHASVPFNRPSTMLTAIAEMNMPASMYIKSI